MDESELRQYHNKITELFEKYKDNSYMKQRVHYHIMNLLSNTLEQERKNNEKRIIRNNFLTYEHKQFIQVFLSKNQYYYLPNNNCFYFYDGKNYSPVKEDIIHYQLLITISKDKKLMDWKYRTKINIIKQIKDRHLLKSIPESITIQNVLSLLYPSIFTSKTQAKYFLTILGDNILKKNNDLIFLIKPKTKKLLIDIENISQFYTGFSNITNNFITKYHENYNYSNCRLLKISDKISMDIWKNMLSKYGIDLICVAAHYSHRFENSDNYINNFMNDESLKSYTFFLKNNTSATIIDQFCKHSIQTYQPSNISNNNDNNSNNNNDNNSNNNNDNNNSKLMISWKNIAYIWKLYLSQLSLPNMIYLNNLKSYLKERFVFDETTDSFHNLTSKYLPRVSDFIQFCENTITVVSDETEFEIDELCILFKKWFHEHSELCCSNGNIIETDVLKILNHFFPNIKIIDNKYVMNIKCNMWYKNDSISESLHLLKIKYNTKNVFEDNNMLIGFDEAYNFYFQHNKSVNHFIASKRYFEKYLNMTIPEYIKFSKFICSSWYL